MAIRSLPLNILEDVLFVPRAIVAAPIQSFADRLALPLLDGEDDLDRFAGLVLSLGGDTPFRLTCHRGSDANLTTVSLPAEIGSASQFAVILGRIVDELEIDPKTIVRQQVSDDPPGSMPEP